MTTIRSLLGVARTMPDVGSSPAHALAALGHLQVYLGTIRQNFEDRHWSNLEAAAHKLAGAAMTLDMPTLGDRSLALETAARAKDSDRAALMMAHLESLLAHVGKGP